MNEPVKQYRFFVDAKQYETEDKSLTGAAIKAKADVPPTYQLFLEEEGDTPDRPISDGEGVNLEGKEKHFFAVPPATFGNR
jgi:hypothetical protein